MARLNRNGELWAKLTQAEFIRDKTGTAGSTTLSAAAAAQAVALTATAITNFGVTDEVRVGNGEASEIVKLHASTAPSGSTITLDAATPLQLAHPNGDTVREVSAAVVGHIDAGSAQVSHDGQTEDVFSDMSQLYFGALTGHLGLMMEFGLLGFNAENLAAVLGMLESRVLGSATSGDPQTLTLLPGRFREEDSIAIRLTGALKNGDVVTVTAMGCELDLSALSFVLARGRKVVLPVRARVTAGILYKRWT